MPNTNWLVRSSRYLIQNWWMSIREDCVELPNGTVLDTFHVVEVPDWACVVAITPAREVVLVRQYRHGTGTMTQELPAGTIDANESPQEAGQRELLEETGYEAVGWSSLGAFFPDPSRQTNSAHIFLATGASRVAAPDTDPSEMIDVELVSLDEIIGRIEAGQFRHGIHVAAILLTLRHPEAAAAF